MSEKGQYCYPFPRPAVTVDIACFAERDERTHILLIQRSHDPCAGLWALPGGFVDENEPLHVAAARELEEETELSNIHIEQFGAYGDPGRDPRGHTVTVAYIAVLPECVDANGADDAADAQWFPIDALPPLAFDHDRIIEHAIDRYNQKRR